MKSTKLLLLTTAICLWVVADLARCAGATVFFDDFSDGNARDGIPTRWSGGRVEDGSLVLNGTCFVSADNSVRLSNVSIRTQLTMPEGGFIGVAARRTPGGATTNYFAFYQLNTREVGVGLGGQDRGISWRPTDLQVTTEDILMQLDVIENEMSVWAWRPNEAMPDEPLAIATDDTLQSGPPFIWVASEDFFTGCRGKAQGVFRFVHVADAHIPDVFGDLNQNGILDADDIDVLSAGIRANTRERPFDLNSDGAVDSADRRVWVESLAKTWFGDSNLDGEFNSADFVQVFKGGQYEDGVADNSTWATGDWDGSGEFDSTDFVTVFQGGGYERGPRAAATSVPEPAAIWLLAIAGLTIRLARKRGGSPLLQQSRQNR